MTLAVSSHENTAHSATQPLRLRFSLPVAITQASYDLSTPTAPSSEPTTSIPKTTSAPSLPTIEHGDTRFVGPPPKKIGIR